MGHICMCLRARSPILGVAPDDRVKPLLKCLAEVTVCMGVIDAIG